MNRNYRGCLLSALFVAAPAFADGVDACGFGAEHFLSTRTHAEVQADLQQAQKASRLPVASETGVRFVDASRKTGAPVTAETRVLVPQPNTQMPQKP